MIWIGGMARAVYCVKRALPTIAEYSANRSFLPSSGATQNLDLVVHVLDTRDLIHSFLRVTLQCRPCDLAQ